MTFEGMSEQQAREQILADVAAYCDRFHNQKGAFEPGDRISYAGRVYDNSEMTNLVDAALEFWLTSGQWTDRFERGMGEYLGIPYVSLVNSGSSANLLAIATLASPELGERRICPGDEVITVACGFPTTVTPIIQHGAVPVFVDMTLPNANVDVTQLEAALSSHTKAVMLAHTLGNPFDIAAVKAFCDEHGLWLIEDNCDALGSEYTLNGVTRKTGTFGDIGTSSFYPPHHMTMGEGGAVYTHDPQLHRIIRSLRDWGRDCSCPSGRDNCCGHRFDGQYGTLPVGYDHKYVYSHFGYNLKATDLQAAVGCAQLEKLPGFVEARRRNFGILDGALREAGLPELLTLPEATPNSDPSWFGYLITCKDNAERNRLVRALEDANIQTRALFAGNLTRHPAFDHMREADCGYRQVGDLPATDRIMRDSFWLGVYPGMTDEMLEFMADKIANRVR